MTQTFHHVILGPKELILKGTKEEMAQAEEEFILEDADPQPDIGPLRKRKTPASKFLYIYMYFFVYAKYSFMGKTKEVKRACNKNNSTAIAECESVSLDKKTTKSIILAVNKGANLMSTHSNQPLPETPSLPSTP